MPRLSHRPRPDGKALQQIIASAKRRNSFAVESDIRKLCSFHDSKQRPLAPITVSRLDWDLLTEGRSHLAHMGYCGAHRLVINGQPV